MQLGLFKTHYSIGRSILTAGASTKISKNYPISVFDIAKEHRLKEVVVLDDSISGFLELYQNSKKEKVKLVYGIRMNVVQDILNKNTETLHSQSKIAVFAKNTQGYFDLIKLSSFAAKEGFYYTPNIDWQHLRKLWTPNLKLCIPFYDNFIHSNLLLSKKCVPDFSFTQPDFFIEDNGVIFDNFLRDKIQKYCSSYNYRMIDAKSIYYYEQSDFFAYLSMRCINNRTNIERPELDYMSSNQFCFESLINS